MSRGSSGQTNEQISPPPTNEDPGALVRTRATSPILAGRSASSDGSAWSSVRVGSDVAATPDGGGSAGADGDALAVITTDGAGLGDGAADATTATDEPGA
jgi:hypothetical protein